jgi:hypothetical protein
MAFLGVNVVIDECFHGTSIHQEYRADDVFRRKFGVSELGGNGIHVASKGAEIGDIHRSALDQLVRGYLVLAMRKNSVYA